MFIRFFAPIKGLLKLDNVWIDNHIFRLHYKATLVILVTASLVVTSRQYIGDPIDCIVEGLPLALMDTYCWIHSTFSVPQRWKGADSFKVGQTIPHTGVAPLADMGNGEPKYHKYYQWVCFVLYLQSLFFYIPRYLWKISEGGKIKLLVQSLMEPLVKDEAKEAQMKNIVKYFRLHRGKHSMYAISFFFCEILNLVNVVGQIFFTDFFLNYEFRTYGFDVFKYSGMEPEDRPDPMAKVFPKVTKCTFYKYGPSGTVEAKDGLCVLPLNIINEKIYMFLWIWFIGLATVTGIFLVYRLTTLLSPQLRVVLITTKGGQSMKRKQVEAILNPESLTTLEKIGDWLILYFIAKNLNSLRVNEVITRLYEEEFPNSLITDMDTLKLHEPLMSSSV